MMTDILENTLINELTSGFHRSPYQVNAVHTSDAEIIRVDEASNLRVAVTTDSIVEEIETGLYDTPYLIGWMTVMANMSDLAAVGARPLGILVSEVLPRGYSQDNIAALQKGIRDACSACKTFVLGGDTNFGTHLHMTGCAVGILRDSSSLTRVGCTPGDTLYASGLLGAGNAYGVQKLLQNNSSTMRYGPTARLVEGQLLRGLASACMDSSDGVLATLDQLMRLNKVGFLVETPPGSLLTPDAIATAHRSELAPWLLLAGQHGEFELLFTIPPEQRDEFHARASRIGWIPIRIGKVVEDPVVILPLYGENCTIDTAFLRNLGSTTGADVTVYAHELINYDRKIRKGAIEHASSYHVSGWREFRSPADASQGAYNDAARTNRVLRRLSQQLNLPS